MWALLDIRQGRANRMQFLLFVLFLVAALGVHKIIFQNQQVIDIRSYFSPYRLIFLLFISYIFFVGMLRRYRDVGLLWLGVLFLIIMFSWIVLSFTKAGFLFIIMSAYFLSFAGIHTVFVLAGLKILFYAFFLFPLLRRGDPGPNEYGYPPVGMILGTMTRATYPPGLLARYQAQERENDKDAVVAEEAYQKRLEGLYGQSLKQTEATSTETQEFKGRS